MSKKGRCPTQLKLARKIEENFAKTSEMVGKYCG